MKKIVVLLVCSFSFHVVFPQQSDSTLKEWQEMHDAKAALYKTYNDLKFGMFIHWGVYSRLGGVWKGEKITPETHGDQATIGEWIMASAKISRKDYRETAAAFNPVGFNAEEWVKVAKNAGMRYIVAMPKHHDGFAMYHSKVSDYNIYDFTPFKRDPMEELYNACKKSGIRFGIYYSHSIDWMDGGDAGVAQAKALDPKHDDDLGANTWDPSPVSYKDYLEKKSIPQVRELLNKFPGMLEIWYDFPRFMNLEQSFDFYKLVYDIQPGCLVNSRVGNELGDMLTAGDNEIPNEVDSKYKTWETPGTLNNTWGYKSYDHDWKSIEEMLFWIVEIASKGGNYLLNVGPDGNGVIPKESVNILQQIGAWMKINGEAIYGTSRWTTMKEGATKVEMKSTTDRKNNGFNALFTDKDIWFTSKENKVYMISLVSPVNKIISVHALSGYRDKIKSISRLGDKGLLKWKAVGDHIEISLPDNKKGNKNGFALKVELK